MAGVADNPTFIERKDQLRFEAKLASGQKCSACPGSSLPRWRSPRKDPTHHKVGSGRMFATGDPLSSTILGEGGIDEGEGLLDVGVDEGGAHFARDPGCDGSDEEGGVLFDCGEDELHHQGRHEGGWKGG